MLAGGSLCRDASTDLADEYWRYYRSTEQLWNVDRGDVDEIEHWEDLSPDGVRTRQQRLAEFARRADALAGEGADGRQQRTVIASVAFSADATATILPYGRDLGLVAGSMNIVAFLTVLVPGYELVTAQHGRGYVTKLSAFGLFVDGWIAGLRDGAASGRIATARGIRRTVAALDDVLAGDSSTDAISMQPPPHQLAEAEATAWRGEVFDATREVVRPGLARLRAMLHDELLPQARGDDQPGIVHIRGVGDDYAALLRASTSTPLTADAIHQLGLELLVRLEDEYAALGAEVLGSSDPTVVRERLRTDTSLRYRTPEAIVADAVACVARAEGEASRWFARLPRSTCAVVPTTAGGMAFYTAPSPDGLRPGNYFINISSPEAWTRFQLEVVTFHESVPGHHLQLALAQQFDLHPVVGELEVTSFGEGWGLYAERLADEMGLYSSPVQRLGMLTLDSLRAARLVVDTGLHAFGWTRDAAIAFLTDHTAQDRRNAEAEVDRYTADPGQATSYMVGRLEIQRLRQCAEAAFGARFDLRAFHDVVLGNGMTPLHELASAVEAWIDHSQPTHSPAADR